ncbi:Ferric-chelate reductase [Operophtera brumata]|uniref:Ferric-chelate reductase n=1 Tax=Operophtera brumata TaxID=104452 RepID=A0A0L7L502_OPEBR|nr:Ferric-chelate reductase [Operophtera brumata]
MISARQIAFLCIVSTLLILATALPDGGDTPPLPGPGLSYEFFKQQAAPSGRSTNYAGHPSNNFAPIEQWLR